jgi:transposase-like protein
MKRISYSGYRFPPEIIQQAIWLYLRFTLSLRDVEDLLAERGITVSYESIRRWINHFGPMIAADLRKRRPKPHTSWHLDEVYLKIDGRMAYLWRAVDAEGEILDVLVHTGQACRGQAHAKAAEEIRFRSRSIDHRRPAVVWLRRPRPRHREAP